jgi:hypothetical protein
MSEHNEPRLTRIENKLDKLADAVVALARMEERMITLFSRMEQYEDRQAHLEGEIDDIKDIAYSVKFAERVFWIVLTGAIGTAFWYFRQ